MRCNADNQNRRFEMMEVQKAPYKTLQSHANNSFLYGSALTLSTAPMQPVTQVSLDPPCDDIRHLQAEQEFCGAIGYFGLISAKPLG
jgi:hypothetical protein